MELAFFEMTLADNYCNGIPLGHTDRRCRHVNGAPLTVAQVYDSASAHLDTAMTFSSEATDAGSVYINRVARVWKARVLIDKDKASTRQAATFVSAVGADDVQYDMTFSSGSGERHVDAEQLDGAHRRRRQLRHHRRPGQRRSRTRCRSSRRTIRAFRCDGDLLAPKVPPEDGVTRRSTSHSSTRVSSTRSCWRPVSTRGCTRPKRKLQAERHCRHDDDSQRALRTTRQSDDRSRSTIPAMAALPRRRTRRDATTLLFREKAFWTFGRGQRLPDLRRLVRQYGRTDDQVFPTGQLLQGRQVRHGRELPGAEQRAGQSAVPRVYRSESVRTVCKHASSS